MGIDYVLDVDCVPKQQLGGVEGLIELVKARSRAETVMRMLRQTGDERPPDQIELEMVLRTPEGETSTKVSVQELIDRATALDPLRSHCAACPANADSPGFGCYRSIPYPIPEAAEQWLLDLLPDDLTTTAGQILVRAIEDFVWDGGEAEKMRDDDQTFFESDAAFGLSYGEGGDAFQIDTDQLFHMLFHVGHIGSTHAFMCCLFLGMIPHDTDVDALSDPAARAAVLSTAIAPQPPGEACEPLARFLHALLTAARLDVDVLIDG
jgi:hypothetical protein